MISKALRFTNDVLDQFLRNRFGLDESRVLLNNLIEGDGSIPTANQNKLVISLINVEKDTNKPFNTRNQRLLNGSYTDISPEERFNLYILVSANFDDYNESLKFLNAAITFFQVNTCLSAATSSNLPLGITKLEFEIEKITYHQMHNLWTAMGAKYQPSVVYKMWLITIQGDELIGMVPSVSKIANTVAP